TMNTYISKYLHDESNIFFSNVYREEYNNVSSKCFNKMNKVIYNDKCKQLDWDNISIEIEESLVERFEDYIEWDCISYKKLSESFMAKYWYKLNWKYILRFENLPECLIKKYQDGFDWELI